MFRVLPKAIFVLAAVSIVYNSQVNAYCARCAKIEAERAEEQAEHPQPVRYYDDQKGFHNEDAPATPAENPSQVQSGSPASGSADSNSRKRASLVADTPPLTQSQAPQQWKMEKEADKFTPDMGGENKFIQESQNRYDRLTQENRQMIQGDREMMREGYDPNEKYFQPDKQNVNVQNKKSNP